MMRIISKAKLRDFWGRHPETKDPLNARHKTVEQADWSTPLDVRNTYRRAGPIGDEFVVFDICNNNDRLVVRVDYEHAIGYVFGIYTHAQYDQLGLKAIDERYRREKAQHEAKRGRRRSEPRHDLARGG